ncbi:MAG TPA: hypothetical protein DEO26_01980 [Candidatus Veblenbacteria bacterium]|uniref:Uncharacterized protein n=2 Tax=Candidatus Vebleniibacteriota TaxID=1817921 RepID=A0A1G2Q1Q7_9BACT|nr:MAG: hypothetical protein UV69_C0022G0020 [Parcubacteria group bacterium GW2011_GWE2_43_12]OHA54506.1 MAG: hypothetical protein A2226_01705 [Candidatus Veblenbacteria bacterium RIFOXYA2_FULL_43_9]OHA56368.1 MAG: hypothetical protein A2441_03455 [Candidatus Veblenbacteria bacterium RIFOXYC2_FULL_42_11]HBZ36472.1 hypothetical protein [Candidatus Veblenbacteria bacterium]HCM45750.1 hypothetical protein [Candidatus Veblenbacteria bacterium]
MKGKELLILSYIIIIVVMVFSVGSLIKLSGLSDDASIALRVLNRDVLLLSFVALFIVRYLWKKF